jgi:hypothetical protein
LEVLVIQMWEKTDVVDPVLGKKLGVLGACTAARHDVRELCGHRVEHPGWRRCRGGFL